jgi:hypothetical protein
VKPCQRKPQVDVTPSDAAALSSSDDCNGVKPPSGKMERRRSLRGEVVDKSVIVPVRHVIEILNAHYVGNYLSLANRWE